MRIWKIIAIVLLVIAALVINIYCLTHAKADDDIECWVLCQPDSFVNVRMNPKKKSIEIGRLECGDMIYTDGKTKNGFLHVYRLNFELGEGWIHSGYIVYSEPHRPYSADVTINSNGRVAARRTINGKRRCWLKDGQDIKVFMVSDEWSVTNKGFVKTEYINLGKYDAHK